MMPIVPCVCSEHFPNPGGQEDVAKSAKSIANHTCSRTPWQLSSAHNQSSKGRPGSSKQGSKGGCWGMASCRLPFLLTNGEMNHTSSIAATPHPSSFPEDSSAAPQAGAGRGSIHPLPVPLQGSQGAAIPKKSRSPLFFFKTTHRSNLSQQKTAYHRQGQITLQRLSTCFCS